MASSSPKYDAFICHASEDKDSVARPLFEALRSHGLNVWYDEFSLHTGDSLSGKIDYGLTHSDYGIIIVSKKFFEKNWPQQEYHAIYTKQVNLNKRIILPIWHEISRDEVEKHSAILADTFAQKSIDGIETIATNLYKEMRGIEKIYKLDSDTGLKDNISSLSKSIRERELLINETEEEFQFIILSKIYLITKGYRMVFIYYHPFSVSLCAGEQEMRRLEKIVQDLIDKNFITSKALGTISITHEGIMKIENLLEEAPPTSSSSKIASQIRHSMSESEKSGIRGIQKFRYDILKQATLLSKQENEPMNIFTIGHPLGILKEELDRIYFYLIDEGLIEFYALGGGFRMTSKGLQRAKENPDRIF